MSTHQILGDAYELMRHDMRGKLGNYLTSLEHRYGDPSVYAAQREEMMAEQAEVVYNQAKTREQALSIAYDKNRDKIRREHTLRLARFVQDKPPRYFLTDPDPDQTELPPN